MNTRVDFYILNAEDFAGCVDFAHKLTLKVFSKGHTIALHADTTALAQQLDERLWTSPPEAFVPHDRKDDQLHVGIDATADVRINLCLPITPQTSTCTRILHIVPNTPAYKTLAREHYRYYQQQGCMLHSHTY